MTPCFLAASYYNMTCVYLVAFSKERLGEVVLHRRQHTPPLQRALKAELQPHKRAMVQRRTPL